MELTPKQVWFFYYQNNKDRALERFLEASDTKAVVSSVVSEQGHKYLIDHLNTLLRAAGRGEAPYTSENDNEPDSDE